MLPQEPLERVAPKDHLVGPVEPKLPVGLVWVVLVLSTLALMHLTATAMSTQEAADLAAANIAQCSTSM